MQCENQQWESCRTREHQIAVLIKTAQDAAVALDEAKNDLLPDSAQQNNAKQIIERVHAACEALMEQEEIPA